ncbi:hypothetical protein SH528x_002767 [Novipirellula sp. SH528]|uniref:hypothetical protein n=1 Tax=Novipirellula sp. SH528 TaxID=3454466 RepID=UPI003F9EC090
MMKHRATILFAALVIAFSLYAMIRYVVNIPADKLGQDAIDYVQLHGNVQYMTDLGPGGNPRPVDVTGVFLVEGSVNPTTIGLLRHLPNLETITIGPDVRFIPIGSPPEDYPVLTDGAASERALLQKSFPSLTVRLAETSRK